MVGATKADCYSCLSCNESGPEVVHVFVVRDTVSCRDLFIDWERVGGYFDGDLLLSGSCGEEDCLEYADSCISAD